MEQETPKPEPQPTPASPARHLPRIKSVAAFLGAGALVLAILAAVVMYWATGEQIRRANQQVANLLIRIGEAEGEAKRLEARIAQTSELVARLEQADAKRIEHVLDLAARHEVETLLQAGAVEQQMAETGRQVADIYRLASWASELEQKHEPSCFRNALDAAWQRDATLRERAEPDGEHAKAFKATDDNLKRVVRARTARDHLSEYEDSMERLKRATKTAEDDWKQLSNYLRTPAGAGDDTTATRRRVG